MKQSILFIAFAFAHVIGLAQFNPLQTQYVTNPYVINPACAGEQGYMSATASYRRQWVGFAGAPETFVFTMDSPVRNRHHNIGIIAAQDNIAVIHQSVFRVGYAYRITGRKSFFAAGVQPGVSFIRYAWNEIVTNNPDDVFAASERRMRYEVGLGLYFHSTHFFAGLSTQMVSWNGQPMTNKDQPILLYTGTRWGNKERCTWTFSILSRYMNSDAYQFDINANVFLKNRIGFGVSYRLKDAISGSLSFRVNEQFQVGYAYDYTLSHLQDYSNGTHEIVVRYDFGYKVHSTSPRSF